MTSPSASSKVSNEEQTELDEFLLMYGHALAAWAFLEEALCNNFHRLLNVKGDLPRLLFFSGRSFATRADMYSAAIAGATGVSETRRKAHKALLKRARQFSAGRNAIAHAIPRRFSNMDEGARLKQGHRLWKPGGAGFSELARACDNFQRLSDAADILLITTWRKKRSDQLAEECLLLVRGLPSQAFPLEDALSLPES